MIEEHECDDRDTCPVCSPRVKKAKPDPVRVEYSFTAKYPGHCGKCNLAIHVGQQAAKLTNGQVVHDWCVEW